MPRPDGSRDFIPQGSFSWLVGTSRFVISFAPRSPWPLWPVSFCAVSPRPLRRCFCAIPPSARTRSRFSTQMMCGRFRARAAKRRRLTSVNAVTEGPYFSPDGSRIAYSTTQQRTHRRIRGERGGWGSAAAYLGADRQPCRGLDAGWQGCSLRLGARQLLGFSPAVSHPCRWHRIACRSAAAERDDRHLLSGRQYAGLRARSAMAERPGNTTAAARPHPCGW